ncbi:MAG: DUF5060 domain-containing protein [Bryobacteraceae bacterium]
MRFLSLCVALLGISIGVMPTNAAALPACTEAARTFYPCEFSFDFDGAAPAFRDEILTIEFRSPSATTYRLRAFWAAKTFLKVRFSPTEPGTWTYRVSSSLRQFDGRESTFSAAESGSPGFVSVANLRHWRTTNKQPHLWLSADLPFLSVSPSEADGWLERRKHDGFTHIRGTLLVGDASMKPLDREGQPNFSYFDALDQNVLAASQKGFVLDFLLADVAAVKAGMLDEGANRELLMRYLVARYGALNATWQGLEHFESLTGSREILKDLAALLRNYDPYNHPRSSGAAVSSSPLLPDGWMNYLMEASPQPELGAVEHQFTTVPEIHVVTATQPDGFRHELWNCTTNGEYPSIAYASLRDEANAKAVEVWAHVMTDTRHWELEPYFDVAGARSVGLEEVEYLAYAQTGGIVELSLPKHKYNPLWINPITGEELPLKDYKGETFSRQTPDNAHDWILQVPREGHKESMLRSYRFESVDPPVQEIETDPSRIPFQVVDPPGDEINIHVPPPFKTKLVRNNRATRYMEYLWWGEIVAGGEGMRLVGLGASGTLQIPPEFNTRPGGTLNLRLQAINANGKAYEIDKVYRVAR